MGEPVLDGVSAQARAGAYDTGARVQELCDLDVADGSNARDLQDLSTLIGQRDHTTATSRGRDGHANRSTSTTKVPILEPAQLRTLPFGTAVLLLRAARPIGLTMTPWTGPTPPP